MQNLLNFSSFPAFSCKTNHLLRSLWTNESLSLEIWALIKDTFINYLISTPTYFTNWWYHNQYIFSLYILPIRTFRMCNYHFNLLLHISDFLKISYEKDQIKNIRTQFHGKSFFCPWKAGHAMWKSFENATTHAITILVSKRNGAKIVLNSWPDFNTRNRKGRPDFS